jgi:hypothetical protein
MSSPVQAHPEARDLVSEGYQEHHVADVIIDELNAVATDDDAWGAKFKVLKENLEHHIQRVAWHVSERAEGLRTGSRVQ